MSPHPFIGWEPVDRALVAELLVGYWPALLTLLLVAAATGYWRWLDRGRPTGKLRSRASRPNLWALPVLVWALRTSVAMRDLQSFLLEIGAAWEYFTKILLFYSFFGLCLLVLLQVVAVALVDRGRIGLGVRGHGRVAMAYGVMAVVLDGFFMLSAMTGRWPRVME